LLIIETSATPPLEPARRLYLRRGYRECGTIPDFYGEGDDKVIFAKRVQPGSPRPPEPLGRAGVPSRT
jgi:ribosomal protein S18 acetylase RimI-like enzyme